ncbi:MAG: hypothetical protein SNJ64_05130 [Endomicrobiia bacterium]
MDSCLHRNDEGLWIPAFAGMTKGMMKSYRKSLDSWWNIPRAKDTVSWDDSRVWIPAFARMTSDV